MLRDYYADRAETHPGETVMETDDFEEEVKRFLQEHGEGGEA